jgi:5-oxoprolinase (ATP-hydrolysing) subunit C
MAQLFIERIGPAVTVQDLGRDGLCAQGLSRGGAVDRLALFEAAALLGQTSPAAALEMQGVGGVFRTDCDTRFALTGARMQASLDGAPVPLDTTQILPAGAQLVVGPARAGVFGYLAFGGGIGTAPVMGSRASHLTAGIGRALVAGDVVPLIADPDPRAGLRRLAVADRCNGGLIRFMAGPQTDLFDAPVLDRFQASRFQRSTRANRQGARLDHDGAGFGVGAGLQVTSDLIIAGDIQIAGDGAAYILLAECQTIGGYPRIGTIIPADLPRAAQAAAGAPLQFRLLDLDQADATAISDAALMADLVRQCTPLLRDPHDITDLLGYQLISGVTAGDDLDRDNNA